MTKITLLRPVVVKAIVTETFKELYVRELEEALRRVEDLLGQVETQIRRMELERQVTPHTRAVRQQLELERQRHEALRAELQERLREARTLELNTEFPQLTVDAQVEVHVGDNLFQKLGRTEIVRGLNLFLVPRWSSDGRLNYRVRRLKDKVGTRSVPTGEVELLDSEAYLLGRPEDGVYHVLEVLNVSRVANAVGSAALAQRALAEAVEFGRRRVAFGRPVLEHPLLRTQFQANLERVRAAFALAWYAVRLLEQVWQEVPPYSARYHTFRLVTHLAKFWTAEVAFQSARWCVDVHGGAGVLSEHGVERLIREALILPIWEGTPHRQVLDGLEVMVQKGAHEALLDELARADPRRAEALRERIRAHLELPHEQREAHADSLFAELASFTGAALTGQG